MPEGETTIRVSKKTREKIKHSARKDEKYEDFIKRLLVMYDEGSDDRR